MPVGKPGLDDPDAEAVSFLDALTHAGIGVGRLDADARYRYVNAPLAAMSQRSPEEMLGRTIDEMHPWLAPSLIGLRERMGPTCGARWAEILSPPVPDGTRWPEYQVLLCPDPDGEHHGTWLLARAVDESPAPATFRLSMLAAHVAFYDLDLRRCVLLRCAGVDTLFGHASPPLPQPTLWWLEYIHPDDRAPVEARLAAWARGGPAPARLEYRLLRSDGSWAHVVDQAQIVRDDDGTPVRALAALCDVSSEYEAHAALRRSETRFRLATLATNDAVYDWDLSSDHISWSSLATLGYPADTTFESLAWWESQLHPDDRARVVADLHAAVARGDILWRDNYRFRRKDGSWAEISDRGYLDRDSQGNLTRMVGAMQDVTEQKRAEAEVRRVNAELERRVQERTAELTASNRELEAFSYSVSHDLRAPLRAIDGFTSALQEKHASTMDEESREWLGRVRCAAQRMSSLIDDLLHLSRVTRAALRRVPVDLGPLFEDVLTEIRRREPERSVVAHVQPMPSVEGDPALLRLVVQNLLENAWKYTRTRDLAHIEVGAVEEGDELRVYVRDDGVGFDSAYANLLFEPFQRLHDAQIYEGSGVGLATVQRVVHRHGGRVGAESEEGSGATFWFTLPRG